VINHGVIAAFAAPKVVGGNFDLGKKCGRALRGDKNNGQT
jgi:hypothetical protein